MDFDSYYRPVRPPTLRQILTALVDCILGKILPVSVTDLRHMLAHRRKFLAAMGVSQAEFQESKRIMSGQKLGGMVI